MYSNLDYNEIKELYQIHSIRDISKLLDVPESDIRGFINSRRITVDDSSKKNIFKNRRFWTSTEIEIMISMYLSGESLQKIADVIDRSITSINMMLYKEGVIRDDREPDWTPDEDLIILNNKNLTVREIKEILPNKRSYKAVQGRKSKLGAKKVIFKGPYKFKGKHGRLHEIMMSEHIGRQLEESECVHHINCCKRDNIIENLYLTTRDEHMRIHNQLKLILLELLPELMNEKRIIFEDGKYSKCGG